MNLHSGFMMKTVTSLTAHVRGARSFLRRESSSSVLAHASRSSVNAAILAAGLIGWGAVAPLHASPILPSKSEIKFTATQNGTPTPGSFKSFSGDIDLDAQNGGTGHADVIVELSSVDIGSAENETSLKAKDWFDVSHFPKASFHSKQVHSLSGGRFQIEGTLAIKGISKPQSLVVTWTKQGDTYSICSGQFVLHRLDFKLGEGDWSDVNTVANDVNVRFQVTVQSAPARPGQSTGTTPGLPPPANR